MAAFVSRRAYAQAYPCLFRVCLCCIATFLTYVCVLIRSLFGRRPHHWILHWFAIVTMLLPRHCACYLKNLPPASFITQLPSCLTLVFLRWCPMQIGALFSWPTFCYLGDSRMAVAENPNKVANIVSGSHAGFEALYRPWLELRSTKVGKNSL